MLSLLCARTRSVFLPLALVASLAAHGQSAYAPQGGEYTPAGTISGDQVFPHLAVGPSGGIVVWQDNVTDGDGSGISAQRLNNNFSGAFSTFRVNEQGAGNQENPHVALLNDGGAVFVWQGGPAGRQHIFARFMTPAGIFSTGDIMVNSYTNDQQITPVVAKLNNGNVIVVWSSFQQDGDKQGVYARVLSPSGEKLGAEFRVNESTPLNQRTPAVAVLSGGGFAVAWISESLRGADPAVSGGLLFNFDVYARLYSDAGVASGHEFKVNEGVKVCANPSLAGLSDGGFTVVWSEHSAEIRNASVVTQANGWDITGRKFDGTGTASGPARRVNSYIYGDQYGPRIVALGNDQMVVWTSLGQDGSREGVYGQMLLPNGDFAGSEFRVNTTTVSQQIHPVVVSDGATRFLVVWASYTIGTRFDLYAQRYASSQPLPQLPAPYLTALSQSKLVVSWAELAGYNVTGYGLYIDGNATPVQVTTNSYLMPGLVAGSTHTVRMDYVLADGRRGPVSASATGLTWGEDANFDGLPDDWQTMYWGSNPANWPSGLADSDGDGVSNLMEWLAGTNPRDPDSALRVELARTGQGLMLKWNTEPGLFYQVQMAVNFGAWSNLGGVRFAAGRVDSMLLSPTGSTAYFRVLRIR